MHEFVEPRNLAITEAMKEHILTIHLQDYHAKFCFTDQHGRHL